MPTIRGTNANNTLRGTTANDLLQGLGGDDVFYWQGAQGNDTIQGGDTSENYDDNPYTPYNPGGDRLMLEGSAGARINFTSTEAGSVTIGTNSLSFSGIERLYGTDGNDIIRAGKASLSAAHDGTPQHGLTLYTRGGHDDIVASRYDDIIDGGTGNDTIRCGAGDDFVHSSTGNDLIYGGAGQENIRWGTGDDTHRPGNDTIYGGDGHDLINIWIKQGDVYDDNEAVGIPGISVTITAVSSAASFAGQASTNIGGASTLKFRQFEMGWSHAGNDNVDGSGATVAANREGFNFNTRWGHDVLVGSAGNDTLVTDEGRDTITGGAGNDQLWIGISNEGDGDRDTLIFRSGHGQDTVYGFDTGLDALNLGGRNYTARETGDGTVLSFSGGDTILLSDVFDFI